MLGIDCAYRAIGRAPHLLQLEFFHALLVWSDGRALDADIVLKNSLGRLDRYSIIGLETRERKIRRDSRSAGGGKGDAERNGISHIMT